MIVAHSILDDYESHGPADSNRNYLLFFFIPGPLGLARRLGKHHKMLIVAKFVMWRRLNI